LESRGYRTYTSRVLDVTLDDHPGALAEFADRLAEKEIDIKYAYSAIGDRARVILSVNDAERARELVGS
jgi:hypothetical protein